jgi:hypothetical protein
MAEPENTVPEVEVFEEEGAATIGSIRWLRELLQRAPWLAASAIFHFILLLAATVIGFHKEKPPEATTIEMRVANVDKAAPLRFPEQRSTVERKGLPSSQQDDSVTDPAIYFPEAEESDHNESADNEDYGKMKGQSFDFISSQTGTAGGIRGRDSNQAAIYDTLGIGGGGGGAGRYGGRFGGKKNLRARGGGGGTEAAVIAGLRWLARHQHPDGHWSTDHFNDICGGPAKCSGPGSHNHDVGLTGLALLAFLGAGYIPSNKYSFEDPFRKDLKDPTKPMTIRFGEVVLNGLRWLKDVQDAEGCFPKQQEEFMYDHAISTLAMAEAAWLCVSPLYKAPAQRGIEFLVKAQNPGRAWRYSVRPGDNDTSVTGWVVMALKSAEMSGLQFPPTCYEGARQWLKAATSVKGVVGYMAPGDPGSVLTGVNEKWMGHPAMTAVGLLTKIFVDRKRDPWMEVAAASITQDPPIWDTEHKTVDYYYWYYAALALFQYDAPNGKFWKSFNEKMKKALVENQAPLNRQAMGKSCDDGSWDPSVDKWGSIGGRVYAVAINVLTLEVYYRYAHVFGGRKE